MLNSLIKWSLKQKWLVTLLAALLLVGGILTTFNMPIDVFPDFSPTQVVVLTEAPGYAPEEVESLVTLPLESSLNGTANVQIVRSVSTIGLSVITVIFNDGTNIFTARQLVSEKLQISRSKLPEDVGQPNLAPITSAAGDIFKFGLFATGSTSPIELRTLVDWTIRRRLMAIPGVANVVVQGGDEKQYQILVDPTKLKQYDLNLQDIVEAAQSASVNATGGFMRTAEQEHVIRGIGRATTLEEIGQAVIATKGGVPILLSQVAKLKIDGAFKIGDGAVNGRPGVIMMVIKQPWANTLELTKAIEAAIDELRPGFPKDVQLVPTFRQADFIEVAVKNIIEALVLGSVLVIVILFVFLQNWRTAFISLIAIPLSLLTAIIALKYYGATINTMTLGGLAIALGEVVDDAVIDVENVYRRLRENKASTKPRNTFQVIYRASTEVRGSVVYATFIVGLVFVPVFAMTGLQGKIFAPLGFAYIIALFGSLIVALTITPALCSLMLGNSKRLPDHEPTFVKFLKTQYLPVLKFSLRNPRSIIVGAFLLFAISLVPIKMMGSEFLPGFEENNLIIVATSTPGTSLETTSRIGRQLTGLFANSPGVTAAGQRAGRAEGGEDYGSSNFSEFDIRLRPDVTDKQDLLKRSRAEFARIPGVITDTGSYLEHRMEHSLSGVNAAIAIKIFGSDLSVLHEKAQEIEKAIKGIPGAADVHVESVVPIPQLAIKIDRAQAARYGLKVGGLSKTIEAAFKGVTVSQILEGQRTFDLFVWFEPQFRNDLDVIKNTLIDTPVGVKVPLSTVASVEIGTSPNTISHEAVSRRVVVQANVSGRDLGGVVNDMRTKITRDVKLPAGYYVTYGGQFEAQEQAAKQLATLSIVAFWGMFVLLIMAFRNVTAAVLILANLPLALIGGVWAALFSGAVLSVGSLVGFITLFGISTRNGIMMVSHFNHLLQEGESFDESLVQGSLDRLSPVLMTALTAGLGVLPIAVLGGAGRELEQPLAIVILGGMFSSTTLTLVVIPALFKVFGKRALQTVNKTPSSPVVHEPVSI